jgi:hypothetical protein
MIAINNKYLKIKSGNKEVVTHNRIFDKYLEHVNLSQFEGTDFLKHNGRKKIDAVYIKLDEPITDFDNITYRDFDLCIRSQDSSTTGNKFGCNIIYIFDSIYSCTEAQYRGYSHNVDLSDYQGKKITGLGFMNFSTELLAYADTTDYNIFINPEQALMIIREDEFKTNMECVGVEFPYHLAPTNKTYWQRISSTSYAGNMYEARLYSIGYGTAKNRMINEYKLDDNEIIVDITNTDFSFALKTGEKRTLFPKASLYAGSSKYPLPRYTDRELQPKTILHPSNNKYPLSSNVKYIIYKYQIVVEDANDSTQRIVLGYYTMNYASDYIGACTVKTKTERRDD